MNINFSDYKKTFKYNNNKLTNEYSDNTTNIINDMKKTIGKTSDNNKLSNLTNKVLHNKHLTSADFEFDLTHSARSSENNNFVNHLKQKFNNNFSSNSKTNNELVGSPYNNKIINDNFSPTSEMNNELVGGANNDFSPTSDSNNVLPSRAYNNKSISGGADYNDNFSPTSEMNNELVGGANNDFSPTSDSNIVLPSSAYNNKSIRGVLIMIIFLQLVK